MNMKEVRNGKVTATDVSNALTNVQTLLTRYEKHIRDCLPPAEAEKPKLRHGDYGTAGTGRHVVIVKGSNGRLEWACGDGFRDCTVAKVEKYRFPILGNIFDHVKAIVEPLEDFIMDGLNVGMDESSIEVISSGGDRFYIPRSSVDKFILNLQRLQYTERKKHGQEKV